MGFSIKVEGDKEVIRKYNNASTPIKNNLNAAVRTLTFMVENVAKRGKYPPAAPVKTGALRASIIPAFYPEKIEAKIGPTVYYGIYVHAGTYKMKARPFMTKSGQEVGKQMGELLKQTGLKISHDITSMY